jgi:hypothetical protein
MCSAQTMTVSAAIAITAAFRRPHVGEVCDPFAIGRGRHEAAVEHVGCDGGDLPLRTVADAASALPSNKAAEAGAARENTSYRSDDRKRSCDPTFDAWS